MNMNVFMCLYINMDFMFINESCLAALTVDSLVFVDIGAAGS
jgi:hypothetical protein